ncbi:MAG: ornithine carbamoyltransferase [Acidobacteriia bacterium]|nr:ornithine carbamoyltransferase [Terriglobia bacterium]
MKEKRVATPAPRSPVPLLPRIAVGDLRKDQDISENELRQLVDLTLDLKRNPRRYASALEGRSIVLLFEKPSLRTRLTFELAIQQLGGNAVSSIGPIGEREPVKDVARNVERWTSGIVARTFDQDTVDGLAEWAGVPVINALSDLYHPCQAFADMVTLREHFGALQGLKLAFVGDGNNVAHSLMLSAARLGMNFSLATPPGYEANPHILAEAEELACAQGTRVEATHDPAEAVSGADAVYTDVWASMGHEHEAYERNVHFDAYRVDETLMAQAGPKAVFMHCLPAKRGQETTDAVMESPQSVVFDQAENRLHAQKALLLMLL